MRSLTASVPLDEATGQFSDRCGASEAPVRRREVDPISGGEWDRLVRTHPDAGIFHSSAWARVLCNTYGHRPCYLHLLRGHRHMALVPVMEVRSTMTGTRGVCVPFADFCGPLVWNREDEHETFQALAALARERGWRHVELRGGQADERGDRPAAFAYGGHRLELSAGLDALEAGLAEPVRRAIRKAKRSGLEVTVERSGEAMRHYYTLHVRTRRRHGLPPQPLAFFENLQEAVIESGHGMVVLARHHGNPVAGAVFLHFGEAAIYKFGASDPAHWPLRPNQLVMREAIGALVEGGMRSLHFGRTSRGDEGLDRFKRSWGSTSEPLHYFRYRTRTNTWKGDTQPPRETLRFLFGRMPLGINKLAGRILYPHLD